MVKKYNFANFLFLIPFFFGMYIAINDGVIYPFEKAIFLFLRNLAPAADIPMRVLTELGSAVGVIAITVLIVVVSITVKHFFDFGLPVALVTIISRIVNITIKNLLDRPRPDFKVLEASESSFPSGHSQNNMALYIAILFAALLIVKSSKIRITLKIVCVALPIIIGITRIYFGVHYISDVISGWSMGVLVAYNVSYLYFKYLSNHKKKDDDLIENRS